LRTNDTAAVEMTALAAGAGPPAKRMATFLIDVATAWGELSELIRTTSAWNDEHSD
jgi:hypothetical protein